MINVLTKECLNKIKTIAIFGDTGSGKTALAYKIVEVLKEDRPIYFLKHPRPELIEALGYHNLYSLEKMNKMQDCVIYLDEPQIYMNINDNRTNKIIAKICSLARQLNITLIISSSDTRVFTKHNESYFDVWLIKDVDYMMVKRGSKIKNAINNNVLFDPNGFELDINEFLVECPKHKDWNGVRTFKVPEYFTDKHSKPYRHLKKRNPNTNSDANSDTKSDANSYEK